MVPEWFYAILAGTLASMPPTIVFIVWYSTRKGLQRDEVVRALRARVETLEKERKELEARVEELKAKLRDTEAMLYKKLREKDEECERRARQLEEACEARVREASRLSSTARTLFEAFRAGAIDVTVKDEECDEIEVQPGKILCCKGGECRVVWPERSRPGEEVIIVKKRAVSNRKQSSSKKHEARRESEASPGPDLEHKETESLEDEF